MTAPERIWTASTNGKCHVGFDAPSLNYTTEYVRADIHAAALEREAALREAIRWAHDTLWELNPSNYGHDEVCKVNDAAVEVILGLAPIIGETHGKSPEYWAERAALGAKP